jgi:hypothetical protein
MLTDAQIAANRRSASNLARRDLGLSDRPTADWTATERADYVRALSAYILKYPQSFSSQDLTTAELNKDATAMEPVDTSFSWGDFASETVSNGNELVGKPLVNLGNSVSNAVNILGTIGPYLAIAGVLFVGYMFVKGKAKAVS